MFAFAYDLLLTCFSIFFWSPYSSYQSSYSWMFSILALVWVVVEGVNYLRSVEEGKNGRKVVPAVSFITNDLDLKDRSKIEPNIFEIDPDSSKSRRIRKGTV